MISSSIDGALPEKDGLTLEQHLARCAPCRQEKEELEGALSMLSSALPGVSRNLAHAITSDLPVVPMPRPAALRWAGIAATVLFALGLIFLLNKPTDEDGAVPVAGRVIGDFEGGALLLVTRGVGEDATKQAIAHWTQVRDGDLLENPSPDAARLGLHVGAELALSTGTRVRVEDRPAETAVILEGDGMVMAKLGAQKVPFVVETRTVDGPYRVRVMGTMFSVTVEGPAVEVKVFEGTVNAVTPDGSRQALVVGDVWVSGEIISEDIGVPLWAENALPAIRDLPDPSSGVSRPPGTIERRPPPATPPQPSMDDPIGGSKKK